MIDSSPEDLARKTFDAYFDWAIAPKLAPLEEVRLRAMARMRWWVAGGIAGALGVLVFAVWIGALGWWAAAAAALVALFCAGVGAYFVDQVAHPAKRVITPSVALYAGVSYARSRDVASIVTAQELRLVPQFDRASFEDFFEGVRAECSFILFEADLKRRHKDSKGRVTYATCFRGQVLRVKAPVRFLGTTVIHRDVSVPPPELKRARLVDPKFEDVFEVYTTDQVEARYLLSPDFMERLLRFEMLLHGKSARAAFTGGELLIVMKGGDMFEAGSMFSPLIDVERARRVLEEFELIHAIIDALMARREPGACVEPNARSI